MTRSAMIAVRFPDSSLIEPSSIKALRSARWSPLRGACRQESWHGTSSEAGSSLQSHRSNYPLVSALILSCVLYTSVYPFDFQYHPDPRGPIGALLATWRTPIYGTDLVANILFYIPLGYFCYLACGNRTRFTTAILIVAGAVVLSAGMEIVQFWEVERTSSIWDAVSYTH